MDHRTELHEIIMLRNGSDGQNRETDGGDGQSDHRQNRTASSLCTEKRWKNQITSAEEHGEQHEADRDRLSKS